MLENDVRETSARLETAASSGVTQLLRNRRESETVVRASLLRETKEAEEQDPVQDREPVLASVDKGGTMRYSP